MSHSHSHGHSHDKKERFEYATPEVRGVKLFFLVSLCIMICGSDITASIFGSAESPFLAFLHNVGDTVVILIANFVISKIVERHLRISSDSLVNIIIITVQGTIGTLILFSLIKGLVVPSVESVPLTNIPIYCGLGSGFLNIIASLLLKGESLSLRTLNRCFIADSVGGFAYAIGWKIAQITGLPQICDTVVGIVILLSLIWALQGTLFESIEGLSGQWPSWLKKQTLYDVIQTTHPAIIHSGHWLLTGNGIMSLTIYVSTIHIQEDVKKKVQHALDHEFGIHAIVEVVFVEFQNFENLIHLPIYRQMPTEEHHHHEE